jgi:hypothetical protein
MVAIEWLKRPSLRGTTLRVSATEAKNRFGSLNAQAKREPLFVEKADQIDTQQRR